MRREERPQVLVAEDDPKQREALAMLLKLQLDVRVTEVGTVAAALAVLSEEAGAIDVVITDMHFGSRAREGGLEIVRAARALSEVAPDVIVTTAYATQENAIAAMEAGAAWYVDKALPDAWRVLLLDRARKSLHVRSLRTEVEQRRREMEADLLRAGRLQASMAAPDDIQVPGWRVTSRSMPARAVSGDFVEVIDWRDGSTVCVIGDAAGHGVRSALVGTMVRLAIRGAVRRASSAEEIRREIGAFDFLQLPDSCTLLMFVLHAEGGLDVLNAGHPAPIVVGSSGVRAVSLSGGILVTGLPGFPVLQWRSIDVEKGGHVVAVTDGVTECLDEEGRELGMGGLAEAVKACVLNERWLTDGIAELVVLREGSEMRDDVTILVMSRE